MFSQAGDVKLIFILTTSRHQAALGGPALVRARTMENAIKSSLIDCLVNVCKLKIRSQHRWCFAFQHRNIKTFWTHSSPLLSAIYIPAVYV